MQDRVYARKSNSVDELKQRILWWMEQDWSAADWQCRETVA